MIHAHICPFLYTKQWYFVYSRLMNTDLSSQIKIYEHRSVFTNLK